MIWRCPKCCSALQLAGRSLICDNRHAYDIARQGYCNLLLADKKNSRQPGDNREMVVARRAFLQREFYGCLVEAMARILQGATCLTPQMRLLDLGCGEGYYLRRLGLQMSFQQGESMGIDISKEAVRRAAASDKHAHYAVASCYDIPLPNASIDTAISVFSPLDEGELSRVLKPGGHLLRVAPGPQHLWALKSRLYANPAPHSAPPALSGFELLQVESVQRDLQLQETQDIHNLLKMTPYFWHGNVAAKNQLVELEHFDVSLDFTLELLKAVAPMAQCEAENVK
ncbi:MAG: methyltransferase domain-containing protein [Cellvibrionaceae bacterium]|nr:methyltransferase domain-containing protein [Cellvibrionaceae bacterium]